MLEGARLKKGGIKTRRRELRENVTLRLCLHHVLQQVEISVGLLYHIACCMAHR